MKKSYLFLVSILFCFSSISFGQAPVKLWDKIYGGIGYDNFRTMIKTNDGGYLLAGYSNSNISYEKSEDSRGDRDYWIVKLDANGNKMWDKTYGGENFEDCWSVIQTIDGGYLLGGFSNSNTSGEKSEDCRGYSDYWIIKIDNSGNIIWDKTFGGNYWDECHAVIQTGDGGYLIGGWSFSNISGEKSENKHGAYDYWVVKIDSNGNKIWDKTYGGNYEDNLYSIIQTADDGYLLGGYSSSNISYEKSENSRGGADYWILKLDTEGNKIWDKTIGGSSTDYYLSGIQTADGGYLFGGMSNSNISADKSEDCRGNYDYWIVKTDPNGNIIWDKTYGGTYGDNCQTVFQTADGGYLLGGYSSSNISYEKSENSRGSQDFWIVKIDATGNKIWDKTLGGNHADNCQSVFQSAEGDYILGGQSASNISGDKTEDTRGGHDYWIVKLGAPNQPPIANDDNYEMYGNTLAISAPGVLTNDTDADADSNPLTAVIESQPTKGTVLLSADGSFTYTIGANFDGNDSFTYKANDGTDDSNVATVNIKHMLYVTNLNDSGDGSLRWTITNANSHSGVDEIRFVVAGTINILSQLPALSDATGGTTIDGSSAPGYSGTPVVELSGTGTGSPYLIGIRITSANNKVVALRIGSFWCGIQLWGSTATGNIIISNHIGNNGTIAIPNGRGIEINASNNRIGGTLPGEGNVLSGNQLQGLYIGSFGGNLVQGNLIGTDVTGTTALGNFGQGVVIQFSANNTIGGTTASARNIISGNSNIGISIYNDGATNNLVKGNYIGTDVTGTVALPNHAYGVTIESGAGNNTIGGTSPGAGNVISGNLGAGIFIRDNGIFGNQVQGNLIGTNATGTNLVGNGNNGILIRASNNLIGGTVPGAQNVISGSVDGAGILIATGINNTILHNSIFSNNGLGIDLYLGGVNVNDFGDGDAGANNKQNFPELIAISVDAANTTIEGSLNSTPNTAFTIEFFSNSVADPSGYGEGEHFMGSSTITTDGNGDADFTEVLPVVISEGEFVTATATDPDGNTSEFSAALEYIACEPPVAICQDITLQLDNNGQVSITVANIDNGSEASCGLDNISIEQTSFDCSNIGENIVTLTITDINGASSNCASIVTVDDITAPVADVETLPDATGECEVTVTAPTATDNCEGTITATTIDPVYYDTQGTYTITWTYDDGNGNTTIQNQTVVVDDVTAPVADVETLPDATGECEVTVTAPTATDNCEGTITATTADPVYYDTQGTYLITWTYDDGNGNTTTQNQAVVVDDVTAPVADVETLPNASGECEVTVTAPTASDNCEGTITATTTEPVYYDAQGTYLITWTYDDGNGNTSSQTQTVVVDDVTAPVADVETLPNATGECEVTVTPPTATDNCEGTITATTADPLTYTEQGTYTVNWTYDDGNGNTSTQLQTVVVDDVTAPVADVETLPDATGECEVTVTAPTATDNCEGTITATTIDPVYYDAQGTYLITWTYDDGNGNPTTQNQTVVVNDVTEPVADVETLPDATGECEVTVTAPTATDNCEGTITATTTDPVYYNVQGTYLITWTYDDGNGNPTTQNQTVVVDDVTAPVADVETLSETTGECEVTVIAPTATDNCEGTITATTTDPVYYDTQGTYTITWTYDDGNGNLTTQNQTVVVDDVTAPVADVETLPDATGECEVTVTAPTATDNCEGTITATTIDPVYYDVQGTYLITWTYDDGNGNSTTQNQTVVVDDVTAPVADFETLPDATGECEVTVTAPTATDNCEGTIIATTADPMTYTEQGTYLITWTYDDGNGNSTTQNQTVVVDDVTAPVADVETLPEATGECEVTVTAPTATDNCEGTITATTADPLTYSEQGTYTVNWTYDDGNGNTLTQIQTVVIEYITPPIVITKNVTVQLDDYGTATMTTSDIDNGSYDNCGIAFMDISQNNFTCGNLGDNTVTLTVTDIAGNQTSNIAIVTIVYGTYEINSVSGPEHPMSLGTTASLVINLTAPINADVKVIWDDGVENIYDGSTGIIYADHIYQAPGVFSVNVQIEDPCNQSEAYVFNYIVIYDPDGGFVTGGGWIDSPIGAFKPDPLLTGKANFGFVAKYKKGSTTPDGKTEFQFKAGNLNFNSSDYEYLTINIAGAKALIKGSGSINGSGNYGFMLSAIDADLTPSAEKDRFRIKIWDKDAGDLIVYDNNINGEDNADPATEISGGSITIHSNENKSGFIESFVEYANLKVYPNPFNNILRFEFVSPENTHARIDIYDVTGRMEKNVFKGSVEAGVNYNAEFEPVSEVSSIYFYRMTLGDAIYNGKVIYKE